MHFLYHEIEDTRVLNRIYKSDYAKNVCTFLFLFLLFLVVLVSAHTCVSTKKKEKFLSLSIVPGFRSV
jgi:hypothetical protein